MSQSIPSSQVRGQFTQRQVAVYEERIKVPSFLANWFPDGTPSLERFFSLEAMRGDEGIAVDTERGAGSKLVTFGKSTEKIFDFPQFSLKFGLNSVDLYDRLMGSGDVSSFDMRRLLDINAMKMQKLVDRIERKYELMRAQSFDDGIVRLSTVENMDFQRKAALVIAYAVGNNFADDTKDPGTILATFGATLVNTGGSPGGVLDIIFGDTAWLAFTANAKVRARADIRRIAMEDIVAPTFMTNGATYHGVWSDGLHNYRLWTYSKTYKDAAGARQNYINPKKIHIISPDFVGSMEYGGVDQIVDAGRPPVTGKFVYGDFVDEESAAKYHVVRSAGAPIMVTPDKMLTAQVIA